MPKRTHLQPKRFLIAERSSAHRHRRSPTAPKTPAPRKSPRHALLDTSGRSRASADGVQLTAQRSRTTGTRSEHQVKSRDWKEQMRRDSVFATGVWAPRASGAGSASWLPMSAAAAPGIGSSARHLSSAQPDAPARVVAQSCLGAIGAACASSRCRRAVVCPGP